MEFSELKIKCGFIWLRKAFISSSASILLVAVFCTSSFLMRFIRHPAIPVTPLTKAPIHNNLNHRVAQYGGAILKDNVAGFSFQSPFSLPDCTMKLYFPGGMCM